MSKSDHKSEAAHEVNTESDVESIRSALDLSESEHAGDVGSRPRTPSVGTASDATSINVEAAPEKSPRKRKMTKRKRDRKIAKKQKKKRGKCAKVIRKTVPV